MSSLKIRNPPLQSKPLTNNNISESEIFKLWFIAKKRVDKFHSKSSQYSQICYEHAVYEFYSYRKCTEKQLFTNYCNHFKMNQNSAPEWVSFLVNHEFGMIYRTSHAHIKHSDLKRNYWFYSLGFTLYTLCLCQTTKVRPEGKA